MFSSRVIAGMSRGRGRGKAAPPARAKGKARPATVQEEDEDEQPRELDLTIRKLKTAKHKIKQRILMEKDVIPRHPSSVIFNGSSGSGKTTLLVSLLTLPQFYGGYFDEIHMFSPTGGSDDLFDALKLDEDHMHTEMDSSVLKKIMDEQKELVDEKGVENAPKLLMIFEDVQGDAAFMRSPAFKRSFLANRHFGMSTWLCGQSFTLTPRNARLQANNLFYFKGSGSEMEQISEEYTPPGMKPRVFEAMLHQGTAEPYSFIHINQRVPHAERYRKNLDTIMDWSSAGDEGKNADSEEGPAQYRDDHDGEVLRSPPRNRQHARRRASAAGQSKYGAAAE